MATTNNITNVIQHLDVIKLEGASNWHAWKFLIECWLGLNTSVECCIYYTAGITGSGPTLPGSPVTTVDVSAGHPFILMAKDIIHFQKNEQKVRYLLVKNLSCNYSISVSWSWYGARSGSQGQIPAHRAQILAQNQGPSSRLL